jgi:hypothetical protein
MFLISEKKNEDKEKQTKIVENNKIKETNKKIIETNNEKKEIKSEKIDSKISKIKSVFTPEILSKNSDVADKLKVLDSLDNPLEKEKVLKDILELLKEP